MTYTTHPTAPEFTALAVMLENVTGPLRTNASADPAAPTLAQDVDRLGALRAEIDRLSKQADDIRTRLEAAYLDTIEGEIFRATFTQVEGSSRTDWKAVAAKLKPSAQLVRAHTKTSDGHTRMTLTAKTAKH